VVSLHVDLIHIFLIVRPHLLLSRILPSLWIGEPSAVVGSQPGGLLSLVLVPNMLLDPHFILFFLMLALLSYLIDCFGKCCFWQPILVQVLRVILVYFFLCYLLSFNAPDVSLDRDGLWDVIVSVLFLERNPFVLTLPFLFKQLVPWREHWLVLVLRGPEDRVPLLLWAEFPRSKRISIRSGDRLNNLWNLLLLEKSGGTHLGLIW